MILSDYATKNVMSYGGGGGHVIFNLHLGVGHSALCQMEEVGHVFSLKSKNGLILRDVLSQFSIVTTRKSLLIQPLCST